MCYKMDYTNAASSVWCHIVCRRVKAVRSEWQARGLAGSDCRHINTITAQFTITVFVIVTIPLTENLLGSILWAPLCNIPLGVEMTMTVNKPFLFCDQPPALMNFRSITIVDPPPLCVNHRCKTDLPRNMCCQCQFETLHRFLPLLVTSTLKSVNHKHICNIYQSQAATWKLFNPILPSENKPSLG